MNGGLLPGGELNMSARAGKFAATVSIIALTLLSIQASATARVSRISFEKLIQDSDIIALARVEAVRTGRGGQKSAEATVLELWKGESAKAIKFLASPTWTCDIANAVEGERAALFLGKRPFFSSMLEIAHSGRGRMPLRDIDGVEYATIWTADVILPRDIPTVPGPDPEYDFIESVELSKLKAAVLEILSETKPESE